MKINISYDGRTNQERWDVVQQDNVYSHDSGNSMPVMGSWATVVTVQINTHLHVERGEDVGKITFVSEYELQLFHKRIALCRAKGSFVINGEIVEKDCYVTSM